MPLPKGPTSFLSIDCISGLDYSNTESHGPGLGGGRHTYQEFIINEPVQNAPLTPTVEDYLKAIYRLSSRGAVAATGDIAAELDVSAPSASWMVKRLSEAGLIEHVPYRGVRLTRRGRSAALHMLRRHRILEVYLVKHLGYEWDDVHEEAERLEHAVSGKLIERMAGALGDPRYDPHGAPIPTSKGEIEDVELVTLAEAAVGATVELRQVSDEDPARLRYLAEQKLTPGTRVTVVERQRLNGTITVRLRNANRVLGQQLAEALLCRAVAR